MSPANSQDLIKIKDIYHDTVILQNGTLVQMILVGGVNLALKSEDEQNTIIKSYQNFLNSIDFTLQIVIHSRKINIDKYLSSLEERKGSEASGLLQSQITEYQEFIRGFVQEYAVMRKVFIVVVPFVPLTILPSQKTISSFIPFFGKSKPSQPTEQKTGDDLENDENFKESVGQLHQRTNQVVDGLRTVGLDASVLTDEHIIELFYNYYNPETIEKEGIALPVDAEVPAEKTKSSDSSSFPEQKKPSTHTFS